MGKLLRTTQHKRRRDAGATVEYAWAEYGEIDPDRKWIAKLRERGGYVISSEKLREALNRHKAPYGTKENV